MITYRYFLNAAKKGKFINELIAKFARLGRNTGVHLILASQELGNEIDKSVMGNIGIRLCLGCLPKTSDQILGNDEAKINFGQKGRLIINSNPAVGSVDDNIGLRTPFLPDLKFGNNKTLFDYMQILEDFGKKAFPKESLYNLSFYDEQRLDYENDFYSYVFERVKANRLFLGEPSFVLHNPDGEKWLTLDLECEQNENILIFTPMKINRERYLKMLCYNFLALHARGIKVDHKVLYADKKVYEGLMFDQIPHGAKYVREYVNPAFADLRTPFWRKLLIECDQQAFGGVIVSEETKEKCKSLNAKGEFSGDFWIKRAEILYKLLSSQSTQQIFGLKGLTGKVLEANINGIVKGALLQFKVLNKEFEKVTLDTFAVQYIWIIGTDSIVGLGVDSKTAHVEELKKYLREGPEYKVHFIVSASQIEDMTAVRSVFTHAIIDNLSNSMQGHLKVAYDYPDTCSPVLGIYFNASRETNKCRKFKRMKFEGEI